MQERRAASRAFLDRLHDTQSALSNTPEALELALYDTIFIGAGPHTAAAATAINRANPEHRMLILEASNELAGIHSQPAGLPAPAPYDSRRVFDAVTATTIATHTSGARIALQLRRVTVTRRTPADRNGLPRYTIRFRDDVGRGYGVGANRVVVANPDGGDARDSNASDSLYRMLRQLLHVDLPVHFEPSSPLESTYYTDQSLDQVVGVDGRRIARRVRNEDVFLVGPAAESGSDPVHHDPLRRTERLAQALGRIKPAGYGPPTGIARVRSPVRLEAAVARHEASIPLRFPYRPIPLSSAALPRFLKSIVAGVLEQFRFPAGPEFNRIQVDVSREANGNLALSIPGLTYNSVHEIANAFSEEPDFVSTARDITQRSSEPLSFSMATIRDSSQTSRRIQVGSIRISGL